MPRKFAITDIHGCPKTFDALLDQIQFTTADELFLLGDYVDRGPDSKAVIDKIFQLQADGYRLRLIRGNHEQGMLDSKYDRNVRANWMSWGGRETLASFGVYEGLGTSIVDVPDPYWDFLNAAEYVTESDNYILVHAGLNFDSQDPLMDFHNCLWIRKWYQSINYDWLGDRIIVHGHTPIDKSAMLAQLSNVETQQYLDIDNGCYLIQHEERGQLCAFDMTNRQLYFEKNCDMSERWRRR